MVWGSPVANTEAVDPAKWRSCADRARREARETADPVTRDTLVEIADAYERLASLAEAKLAAK